jgi:hypothetical protein
MARRGVISKAEHTKLVQLPIQKKDGHWVGLLAIEKSLPTKLEINRFCLKQAVFSSISGFRYHHISLTIDFSLISIPATLSRELRDTSHGLEVISLNLQIRYIAIALDGPGPVVT